MSKELKLSDIRKWTDLRNLTVTDAQAMVAYLQAHQRPLGILAEHCPCETAILQKAPNEAVQQYRIGEWVTPSSSSNYRCLHLTYRLHPDVTVVDDTAEDGEYEFASVSGGGAYYVSLRDETWAITTVPIVAEYICTEVEDANGQRGFVRVWQGPSTQEGFGSIEVVGSRLLCLDGPLTPKNVVFRKGN